jgi:hypothetical protein
MTASTAPAPARTAPRARLRTVVILAIAAVLAVAVNALVASLAVMLGASADYGPLTVPAYASFTVLGVVLGAVGWSIVRRRARDPRRTLAVLVPALTLLSLVPDVLLLTLGFIPGTTTVAAVALMVMHLVVVGIAVPSYVLAFRGR